MSGLLGVWALLLDQCVVVLEDAADRLRRVGL